MVEEIQEALTARDVVTALEDDTDQRIPRLFMELTEPEFEVSMVGPGYSSARRDSTGLEGLVEAWTDWTTAFESYRIEVEEMIDAGDQVVSFVAMTGELRGGGEITAPGAAVWTVIDGRVRRVEFHLDRGSALRAAGLE